MKLTVLILLAGLSLTVPSLAAPNRITPVIDDETFESNFRKGVQESVTLKDGRVIHLHQDFTWEFAPERKAGKPLDPPEPSEQKEAEPKTAREAVEVWDSTLDTDTVDYSKAVRLFLHYKNNGSRKVVGVAITVSIRNSFGKLLYQFSKDDEVVVEPGEQMKNETFFVWKDNPFIDGEPYDLLWQAAQNGTAKVSVTVRKVILEGGKVLTNPPAKKK